MNKKLIEKIDSYRLLNRPKKLLLTNEQLEFFKYCREKEPAVSYRNMAEIWRDFGWGNLSRYTMAEYYKKVKEGYYEIISDKNGINHEGTKKTQNRKPKKSRK